MSKIYSNIGPVLLKLFLTISVLNYSLHSQQIADVVFNNGKIYTADKEKPLVRAVAVLNGKILAVGSSKEIQKYVRDSLTTVIDLKSQLMELEC